MKTILIIFLSIFFIICGINHLFNSKTVEEYAKKRSLFSPHFSVITSGIGMIIGGIMLLHPTTISLGAGGLAGFVIVAALLIHRFWDENDKEERMLETQNFIKNWAIAAEMLYLAIG